MILYLVGKVATELFLKNNIMENTHLQSPKRLTLDKDHLFANVSIQIQSGI